MGLKTLQSVVNLLTFLVSHVLPDRKTSRVRTPSVQASSSSSFSSKKKSTLSAAEQLALEQAAAKKKRGKTLALLQRRLALLKAREAQLQAGAFAPPPKLSRSNSKTPKSKATPKAKTPRANLMSTPQPTQRHPTPHLSVHVPALYTPTTASPFNYPIQSPGPLSAEGPFTPGGDGRRSSRVVKYFLFFFVSFVSSHVDVAFCFCTDVSISNSFFV